MRIQINKTGLEWPDFGFHQLREKTIEAYEGWGKRPKYDFNTIGMAYLCKNCGAENYGIWRQPNVEPLPYVRKSDPRKFFEDALPYGITDEQIEEGKSVSHKFGKLYWETEKELESVCEHVCPLCGGRDAYLYNEQCFISKKDYPKIGKHYDSDIPSLTEVQKREEKYQLKIDKMFSELHKEKRKDMEAKAKKLARGFSGRCNVPASMSIPANITTVRESSEKLKDFILNLIQLETNILSLTKRLESLYQERLAAEIAVKGAKYYSTYGIKQQSDEAEQMYKECVSRLSALKQSSPEAVNLPAPEKPTEPEYESPGFFNKRKILAKNAERKEQYLLSMEQYSKACEEHQRKKTALEEENKKKHQADIQYAEECVEQTKRDMEQAKADLKSSRNNLSVVLPEMAVQHMIAKEVEATENLLKRTFAARKEMYACNIVFSKYQDLVALSTFYEYLMAGRCTTLEGANGAYNLYEAEVRANMIISKLSDIVDSLEKIQKNQYMIYSKLSEMNRTLYSINHTMHAAYSAISGIQANTQDMTKHMERIAQNSNVIAYNTAATAYYTKVNAELTNALGFMIALN